jgi:hypothetical protein
MSMLDEVVEFVSEELRRRLCLFGGVLNVLWE